MAEMAAPEDQVSCVPTSEIDQLRRDSAVLKLLIEYILEWGKDYPDEEILTGEKFYTLLDHPVLDVVRKKNRLFENAKGAAFFLASIVSTGCGVCDHSHDDHGHNEDSESSEDSEEYSSTTSDNDDDDDDWSDFESWDSEEADSDYVTDADSHSNDEGGDVNDDSEPVVDQSEEVVPAAPANNFQSDSSDGGLAMEEEANWADVVWAPESSWDNLDTSTSGSSSDDSDESSEEEREGSDRESEGLGECVAELEKEIALGIMMLGDGQDSSGFSDSVSDEQEVEEDDSNASDESSDHTDSDDSEDGEDGNSDSNEESNDETGSSSDSSDEDYEPPQPNAHKHVIPTLFFCEDHGSWYRLLPEVEKRKCLSVVHPDVMVAELRNFFSQADVGPTKKKFIEDLMKDYLF